MVVKILVKVYAKEGKSRDEVLSYWLNRHAPLFKRLFGDKMRMYVINIVMSAEGEEPGYLGTVEQWYDTTTDVHTVMSSPAFVQQIMPDHTNFARKVTWVIFEEHTII